MPITVEFTAPCAGRDKGQIETVYDETLAQAWIDSGAAKPFKDTRVKSQEDRKMGAPPRGKQTAKEE